MPWRPKVRLFDRLFVKEDMNNLEEGKTFEDYLNPDSLRVVTGYLEPALGDAKVGEVFQFERFGIFFVLTVIRHRKNRCLIGPLRSRTVGQRWLRNSFKRFQKE